MPLSFANMGETVMIKRIAGQDEVRQHLAELGFVVGELVTIISKLGGNLIVSVKETRVALDQELVKRILI